MSVLTLDPQVFNYIRSYLEKSAYRTECDIWYNYTISAHFKIKDIETESLRLVRAWAELNEKSYNQKYKNGENENIGQFVTGQGQPLKCIFQVLKYMHCLNYNIEPEHWALSDSEREDYDLLKDIIKGLESAIINATPEYKNANWSNI